MILQKLKYNEKNEPTNVTTKLENEKPNFYKFKMQQQFCISIPFNLISEIERKKEKNYFSFRHFTFLHFFMQRISLNFTSIISSISEINFCSNLILKVTL